MSNESKYEKIIKQQHHVSKRHPQLSKDSYAAQFSPFAALTGYDGIVCSHNCDEVHGSEYAEGYYLQEVLKSVSKHSLENILNHLAI